MTRKVVLSFGVAASLLYVAMNAFVPLLWKGYSVTAQAISELSAIGAPTRAVWVGLGVVYCVLLAGFGWALATDTGARRPLRIAGALMVVNGALSLYWPPMHLRGADFGLTDALHIVWSAATVALMLGAMGFAAAAFGRPFRMYSLLSVVVLAVCGVLTAAAGPLVAADLPTPGLGTWERVSVGTFMVWLAVLSVLAARSYAARSSRRPAAVAPAV